jgi:hypothetical protein
MADVSGARNNYSTNALTITNGAATAVWEVTESNLARNETAVFGITYLYTANTTASLPPLSSSTMTASLGPAYVSPLGTTALQAGVVGGAIPRFVPGTDTATLTIVPCVTDLLFPFVATAEGYDTLVTIANAALDPFNTPRQTGNCTLWYYGTGNDGARVEWQQTTPVVYPGAVLAFSVQTGGADGSSGLAAFTGYLMAQCRFQFAHGFAIVGDPAKGLRGVGYPALVLDSGAALPRSSSTAGTPAATAGEAVSH